MTVTRDAVLDWIKAYAAAVERNKGYLTQLDGAIGDVDHGTSMDRGFQAVLTRLPGVADKDIGTILRTTGITLGSAVGGASGAQYCSLFTQMGAAMANKLEFSQTDWVDALEAGLNGVVMRGKANLGDKTMVDALTPAVRALKAAAAEGASLPEALQCSAQAAEQGMLATTPLVARKGRASYLGERSAGHQDPGATSSHMLLKAAADTWANAV